MSDRKIIYADDAIDAIGILLEQSEDDEHDKTWNNAIRSSINAVKHHLPSAQPEQSVAQERYEDLCEYFGNDHDVIKTVLGDRKEFKAWLERVKWHVKECDKLSKQLEAQPEIIHCRDCKHWEKETTDKGYCKDLYGFGRWWKSDDYCSYAERRKE